MHLFGIRCAVFIVRKLAVTERPAELDDGDALRRMPERVRLTEASVQWEAACACCPTPARAGLTEASVQWEAA